MAEAKWTVLLNLLGSYNDLKLAMNIRGTDLIDIAS